jgi:hypothetical protein
MTCKRLETGKDVIGDTRAMTVHAGRKKWKMAAERSWDRAARRALLDEHA